jgi:hypothetical protein
MTVGYGCDKALASERAAVPPRHVGCRPGLVNEDKPIDAEVSLARTPSLPRRRNIFAFLLGGVAGLFLSVMPSASSVAYMVAMHTFTPRLALDHSTSLANVASGCAVTCATRASRW